mmetsp:Transcript_26189/g.75524  ORF Transcript_26189/g.75524 Transcript_26189/m.75524 type:complete len:219 (+) Transcript_26189:606-1262(+)
MEAEERELAPATLERGLVDEHGVRDGVRHEPGGQVHGVAHDGVLPPRVTAHHAAVDAAGGDADAANEFHLHHKVAHLQAGAHSPGRVVDVHERRQAEDEQEEEALVVDEEFVEAPLLAVADALHAGHERAALERAVVGSDVHALDLHKNDGHSPHLVDASERAGAELLQHGSRDEAHASRQPPFQLLVLQNLFRGRPGALLGRLLDGGVCVLADVQGL